MNSDYFSAWMHSVGRLVEAKVGLSPDDLPDGDWRTWFETGMTPPEAISTWQEQFRDEFGDLVEALD